MLLRLMMFPYCRHLKMFFLHMMGLLLLMVLYPYWVIQIDWDVMVEMNLHCILLLHRYDHLFLPNRQEYIFVHGYCLGVVALVYMLDGVMAMDVVLVLVYMQDMVLVDNNLDNKDYMLLASTKDRISMDYNTMSYNTTNCSNMYCNTNCMELPMAMLLYLPMLRMVYSHRLSNRCCYTLDLLHIFLSLDYESV